ncbi:MAG: leucine-rich repeat domain-containing protein [Candidatus Limivicinus sp.]|jgi:hypothetical protein
MLSKKIYPVLLAVLTALLLCGCGERVSFEGKNIPADRTEISVVLEPGEIDLLDSFPALEYADLSGSSCYDEIVSWGEKHPEVEIFYTVAFPGGITADSNAAELDLSALSHEDVPGASELLRYLPELRRLILSPGDFSAQEVMQLVSAREGLETDYSFHAGGTEIGLWEYSLDLKNLDSAGAAEAAEILPFLPNLEIVYLGDETSGRLSWDDIFLLTRSCPDVCFKYQFGLWGKEFSLEDREMDLNHIWMDDGGTQVYRAARCMNNLEYLDMDFCGVSNENMKKIRDSLPDVEVVWRVWFGSGYSVRTDTEKILASKPSQGGFVTDRDGEALSCCRAVKYLDLGHNDFLSDISFVSDMPELEVLIVAMDPVKDLSPLADCKKLEYLEIQTNNELTDISPLGGLTELRHLNMARCPNVSDISPLYNLTGLKRLWLGSSRSIPAEQVEKIISLLPNCKINTTVFNDPTTEGWRVDGMDPYTNEIFYNERYELLCEQFGYLEDAYSFAWKDPKYEAKTED